MDAKTALRRAAARAITQPDFDPTGIPDIESLRKELQHHCPEFFIGHCLQDSGTPEQLAVTSPVR